MNRYKTVGFTIIETMLFLAITGALAVGILAGSSLTISTQRYQDSVTSLQALLQQQYSMAFNVVNSRDNHFTCNSDAAVVDTDAGPGTPRGQTNCVIMGRYVAISGGTNITVANIIGAAADATSDSLPTNDLKSLQRYHLSAPLTTSNNFQTEQVNWGVSLYDVSDSDTPSSFVMLILRSPLSGAIQTFISEPLRSDSEPASLDLNSLVDSSRQVEKRLCFDPGSIVASGRRAVVIRAQAAGPSGIETLEETSGC